jgi:phosphatidylinositol-3-phosphatase
MHRRIIACVVLAFGFLALGVGRPQPAAAATQLQHIYYIMMENQGFDDVIGHENASYVLDTPFITNLAFTYGLETMSFGTTHPSLPNYLSLIGGSYYGVQDDNPSCFAVPKQSPCDKAIPGLNLIDELEGANLTWLAMEQSMPKTGYLGPQFPTNPNGSVHYAQKHNPFVYFQDIATNPKRLARIVPLTPASLGQVLSGPMVPNFIFMVPDQCHDMHGTNDCPSGDALLMQGDKYVNSLVTTIMRSKAFTSNSAIILSWDENDYSSNIGCCGSPYPHGGGHMPTIVITPQYAKSGPVEIATPSNHYNELRSIEDAFGLGHVGASATQPPSLNALLYPQFYPPARRF